MLAIELSKEIINDIFDKFSQIDTLISVDINTDELIIEAAVQTQTIQFQISKFDKDLIQTGGWVDYADKYY
jgi:3-isopropylmalate/(R)-2-methylmalate dehydratase small subunit